MQEAERLVWLPDENRSVPVETGLGSVRFGGDSRLPREAARAMQADPAGGVLSGQLQTERRVLNGADDAWKGWIAAVLLWDEMGMDSVMKVVRADADSGRLTRNVLQQMDLAYLEMCVLEKEGRRCILGMPDEDLILIPAQQMDELDFFLTPGIPWYDAVSECFISPVPFLDDRQRRLLCGRLRCGPFIKAARLFADELEADWEERRDRAFDSGSWMQALEGALCLEGETGFEQIQRKREPGHPVSRHPVLEALGLLEPVVYHDEKITWYQSGVCFAQSDGHRGILPVDGSAAEAAIHTLAEEEKILLGHSPSYAAHASDVLNQFVHGQENLDEKAVRAIAARSAVFMEKAGKPELESVFVYPWREDSPALMRIMDEKVGGTLARAFMHPFSDRLALMDGAVMGPEDQTVVLEGLPWKVLPPVSEDLAAWTAEYGWTGGGVQPGSFGYSGDENGHVTVTVSYRGERGAVTLRRTYASMEQVRMSAEQIPEVSLWPAVPVERGRWQAYYVSVRGRGEICVFDRGEIRSCGREDVDDFSRCHVAFTRDYPYVILLRRNHLTLGALIHVPGLFHPEHFGTGIGAVDAGDAGCGMAMNLSGVTQGVSMPSLWKVCLAGARKETDGEALPVLPVQNVVETAVVLEQVRLHPRPFEDGWMTSAPDTPQRTALRHFFRRDDREARAARGIMLRQVFLMMSLHAVMNGMDAVEWRLTCPMSMSDSGRKNLEEEAAEAAADVAEMCGVPSAGLHTVRDLLCTQWYLYTAQNRSSFMVLDAGSSETQAAVWLRGRSRPVLETGLGYGFVTRALIALMQNPEMAEHDLFGLEGFPTEDFLLHLGRAGEQVEAGERALAGLDLLFGRGLEETARHMNQSFLSGNMTGLQAVLLLYLAQTLTLCGVCLEKVYQSSLLSDALPEDLPLVFCGRGSWVYTALDPTLRYQLMRFLRLPMSRSHPVQRVHLMMSQTPKMEAALGLAGAQTPEETFPLIRDCTSAVSMETLVGHFLMLFQAALPQACSLLFPDRFGPGGLLQDSTFAGIEDLCQNISGKSFSESFLQIVETLRLKRPFLRSVEVGAKKTE